MITFGCKLRKLRSRRHVTQAALASALHVRASSISLWERNKELPEGAYLESLADFFEMSVEELTAGTNYIAVDDQDAAEEMPAVGMPFSDEEKLTVFEMYDRLPPCMKEAVDKIVLELYKFSKD